MLPTLTVTATIPAGSQPPSGSNYPSVASSGASAPLSSTIDKIVVGVVVGAVLLAGTFQVWTLI